MTQQQIAQAQASVWCYPTLPLSAFVVWAGCGFMDPGYWDAMVKLNGKGSVHPGTDFNGRGGGNTDEGTPIRAMCTGRVTHAQQHRVWGWVIELDHPGEGVQTQYAHCKTVGVKVGDIVRVGEVIGTMGRGGKNKDGVYYYMAHLHCEVRTVTVPADEWPSLTLSRKDAETYISRTRHDPVKWLALKGAAQTEEGLAAQLAQAAASVTPPTVKPSIPAGAVDTGTGPRSNWVQVRDAGTGTPLPGDWVSVWQDGKGQIDIRRVERWKLTERGMQA